MAAEAADLARASAKITKVIGRSYTAQVRLRPYLALEPSFPTVCHALVAMCCTVSVFVRECQFDSHDASFFTGRYCAGRSAERLAGSHARKDARHQDAAECRLAHH